MLTANRHNFHYFSCCKFYYRQVELAKAVNRHCAHISLFNVILGRFHKESGDIGRGEEQKGSCKMEINNFGEIKTSLLSHCLC